jgi:PAS domain S-box-containing protein
MEIKLKISQLYVALERLEKIVTDRHRRLREAFRAREHELRELLASSLDAIAVANADHRFVAANQKAQELFGISETNIRKFNIEAFLSSGQIPELEENGSPFVRRKERHGTCEIRRLDGGVCVVEYMLIANFLPLRHLCQFRNIVAVPADVSRSPSLMAGIASRRASSTSD